MKSLLAAATFVAFSAACAASATQPTPPPVDKRPCTDDCQKMTCPESIDCMPGTDKKRMKRCAWVKKHCPDTKIWY
ncbi:MAG: hypothetical protein KGJ78_10615 [Alphaproteobacteria bacterium]|nr:hypothetical protein [Alphaproteobacteria bacterium]